MFQPNRFEYLVVAGLAVAVFVTVTTTTNSKSPLQPNFIRYLHLGYVRF